MEQATSSKALKTPNTDQMKAFIEKARSDTAILAKLDALGAAGASADKIVALAAEYGYTVTEEECREAAKTHCPHYKH